MGAVSRVLFVGGRVRSCREPNSIVQFRYRRALGFARAGTEFVCCNQVEVSAATQSRIVTRSYFGAAPTSVARRCSNILSTKLFLPGGFRPVFWIRCIG